MASDLRTIAPLDTIAEHAERTRRVVLVDEDYQALISRAPRRWSGNQPSPAPP